MKQACSPTGETPEAPGSACVLYCPRLLLYRLLVHHQQLAVLYGDPASSKFPSDTPSRSTLKLEEAFHVFIPADEWDERLATGCGGGSGACPGGWTYQLVKRNVWVSSVDNGPMAQSLMDTGQVTRLREDGFEVSPNAQQHLVDGGTIWWRNRRKWRR